MLFITLLAFLAVSAAEARVLRVPQDLPTIQSALDSSENSDTVLVQLGEYYESLVAPNYEFWLLGDVEIDTVNFIVPVIDPSLSQDSLLSGCLTLVDSSYAHIERVCFRNRRDMRGRVSVGGVRLEALQSDFAYCSFDSAFYGIRNDDSTHSTVRLDHCRFNYCRGPAAFLGASTALVNNCHFKGTSGLYQLYTGPNSIIENSHFELTEWAFVTNWHPSVIIRNCLFGPGGPHNSYAVELVHFAGTFENNLLFDLVLRSRALEIEGNCEQDMFITGNRFVHCDRHPNSGASMPMFAYCDAAPNGRRFFITANVIYDCRTAGDASGIWLWSNSVLNRNSLHDLLPHLPAVGIEDVDSVIARENVIYANGMGMRALHSGFIDARWNYWGDSTGPYHPTLNPDGQGDQVGDNILFDPWYPDTNFLATAEPNEPLPQHYALTVYPNPFNAQTTLQFDIPEAGIYSIALFDVLGRQVRELFRGPALDRETIHFNSEQLSSGIYFARAWDVIELRPVATTKLILLR